jgi:hypothetical protein
LRNEIQLKIAQMEEVSNTAKILSSESKWVLDIIKEDQKNIKEKL